MTSGLPTEVGVMTSKSCFAYETDEKFIRRGRAAPFCTRSTAALRLFFKNGHECREREFHANEGCACAGVCESHSRVCDGFRGLGASSGSSSHSLAAA